MFTVRVTFWVIILLTILSSLLDGSGEFDIKLTKIENGNSTIENAVSEINIDNQKHQFSPNALNNEIPLEFKEQKEKRKVPESITEIHSSFGETLSLNTDFKSEIIHRKGTNAAPSVSQVDVSNRYVKNCLDHKKAQLLDNNCR